MLRGQNLEIVDVRDRAEDAMRLVADNTETLGKIISRFTLAVVFYHTLPQVLNHRYFHLLTGYSIHYETTRRLGVFFLMSTLYALLCLWFIRITPQDVDLARMARHAIKSVALIIV